MRNMVLYNLKI